jgi:hypothetical protein
MHPELSVPAVIHNLGLYFCRLTMNFVLDIDKFLQ